MFAAQEILALLVSYEDDMNRVPSDRSVKANYIPRQEIKLGRMPEISIINYDCFVRTEETILLIKTMDTIAQRRMSKSISRFPSEFREHSKYILFIGNKQDARVARKNHTREARSEKKNADINAFAFDFTNAEMK